jgi:hypothetical protein
MDMMGPLFHHESHFHPIVNCPWFHPDHSLRTILSHFPYLGGNGLCPAAVFMAVDSFVRLILSPLDFVTRGLGTDGDSSFTEN